MQYVIQIPFQITGNREVYKAIQLSDASSLLTIAADNPFGATPAYFGGIGRSEFVSSFLAGKFALKDQCVSDVDAAHLRKLLDRREAAEVVWRYFLTALSSDCAPQVGAQAA